MGVLWTGTIKQRRCQMASVSGTEKANGLAAEGRGKGNGDATVEDVQAELEKLRNDIAALTQTLASFGNGKLKEAGDRASQLGADVAEASAQYVDTARTGLAAAEQDLEAHIRSRPFQSVAVAAGIGFVAALLTRR
ncbi:hypothetical protein ACO34A_17825 [Rhizobium sp. ACO-34A]|nr:hypothetical protein ACO34A_17825 [Rhizobium sp. ACO-34A]